MLVNDSETSMTRQEALNRARASNAMEGLDESAEGKLILDAYGRDEIDGEETRRRLLDRIARENAAAATR